ncbi:MAG: hypothetical protein WD993_03160 [Thermoleophilaceae bacterium]
MADGAGASRFGVRVDQAVFEEDLAHATEAGRTAITRALREVAEDGVPRAWLKRCADEARDGTRLPGCVKFYIPQPDGRWGAVLTGDKRDGTPTLVLLAIGERHPAQPWRPSVYRVAHNRLNKAA